MTRNAHAVVEAVAFDISSRAHFDLAFLGWTILRELFAISFLPCFTCCYCKILILGCVPDNVAISVFALTLHPVSAVSFWFVSSVCLLGLVGGALLDEFLIFLFSIFLKDMGRFIWKDSFRISSVKSSKSGTLSFTCVQEMVTCSHILSHLWTLLLIAKRNFAAKNFSRANWLQKLFLFCPTRCRRLLSLSVQTLSLPKKIINTATKSWSWVPRFTQSKGMCTACFRDTLILSRDFFLLVLESNEKRGSPSADLLSLVLAYERQIPWSCLVCLSQSKEVCLGRGLELFLITKC